MLTPTVNVTKSMNLKKIKPPQGTTYTYTTLDSIYHTLIEDTQYSVIIVTTIIVVVILLLNTQNLTISVFFFY
jgi:uncharacterized integral membrane protein